MLFNLLLFCFSRQEKYSLLSNKLPFTKFCIQPALSEENLDKKHLCLLHLQNLFREQVPQPLPAPLRTLTCRKRENDQDSCPQQKFGWSHIFTHNYKDLFKILLQSMLYTLQLQNGLTVLSQVKPIKSSIFSSAKKAKKKIYTDRSSYFLFAVPHNHMVGRDTQRTLSPTFLLKLVPSNRLLPQWTAPFYITLTAKISSRRGIAAS